jgi:hypothetical protein
MRKVLPCVVVATALAAVSIATFARGEAKATVQSGSGRYQVVNGTPEMARNIMLLDSATGETWIACIGEGGASNWCHMVRTRVTTGGIPEGGAESPAR